MTRIFFSLALFALVLLGVNLTIGLTIGDYNSSVARWRDAVGEVRSLERQRPAPAADQLEAARKAQDAATAELTPRRDRVRLHWLFGLSAALVTVLVNSVTVTYFIGTSRWCKEVCDAYSLNVELAARCARLKKRTFPWCLTAILVVLGIVALGAASEPGNSLVHDSASWVQFHFLAALGGLALIAFAFLVQANSLLANYRLIQEIMDQVRQIRTDRGLETADATDAIATGA
ncbi:MAG: hypothetical protein U0939_23960 [Pirellulales bacterium]